MKIKNSYRVKQFSKKQSPQALYTPFFIYPFGFPSSVNYAKFLV